MKYIIVPLIALLGSSLAAPQSPGSSTAPSVDSTNVDDAARCIPGLYGTKAKCQNHCHGHGHKCQFTSVRPHWACICPSADQVEARAVPFTEPSGEKSTAEDSSTDVEGSGATSDARCIPGVFHSKTKCRQHCHGPGHQCAYSPENGWTCNCPTTEQEMKARAVPSSSQPVAEGSTTDVEDSDAADNARCVPGVYATKTQCRNRCHGPGHECNYTPDSRPNHWICTCGSADQEIKARAAAPAPEPADNTATDNDTNEDTANGRCIPGTWPTKAKCQNECHGRGHCQFEPDIMNRKWVCNCPFEKEKKVRRADAAPAPQAPSSTNAESDSTTTPDADTSSVAAEDTARCINGEYGTKAECKRHCHGGGRCDFVPDVRKHWLCICT